MFNSGCFARSCAFILFIGINATLMFSQAQAQESASSVQQIQTKAQERAGVVKLVKGSVQAITVHGAARQLQSGDFIYAAERIQTQPESAVSAVLKDGTSLMLGASSQINLAEYQFDGTTHQGNMLVSVLKGTMRMITGLISKTRPESIRVTTPTSTIGVLGTDFIVEVKDAT